MVSDETHIELKHKIEKLETELAKLKDAEKSLKRERDFIYEVLYWTDSLVVVIDLNGYIVSFNTDFRAMKNQVFISVFERLS